MADIEIPDEEQRPFLDYELGTSFDVYDGRHSMAIMDIDSGITYDTWDDWRLIPSEKPTITPPELKTEYVDLPGEDGSLDFTGMLSGLKFKDRSGSWEFIHIKSLFEKHNPSNSLGLYSTMLNSIHGRRCRVTLRDDPDWYYLGRLAVSSWKEEDHWPVVTINYLLEPYKKSKTTIGKKSL